MDRSILAGRWHGRKIALMVALAAALLVLFASAAYAAHVEGTNGPDVLVGTAHQDTLIAKGGADTVKGLKGSDTLLGGGGDDVLIGGPGPDVLRGGYGDDNLYGGPDNTRGPQQGADEYFCGAGYDVIHLEKDEHSPHHRGPDCEEVVKE